jgi:hypothetical protein
MFATKISLVLGGLVYYLFREIQRILVKINQILESTKSITQDVQWPLHALVSGLQELLAVLTTPKAKEASTMPPEEQGHESPDTELQPR